MTMSTTVASSHWLTVSNASSHWPRYHCRCESSGARINGSAVRAVSGPTWASTTSPATLCAWSIARTDGSAGATSPAVIRSRSTLSRSSNAFPNNVWRVNKPCRTGSTLPGSGALASASVNRAAVARARAAAEGARARRDMVRRAALPRGARLGNVSSPWRRRWWLPESGLAAVVVVAVLPAAVLLEAGPKPRRLPSGKDGSAR
mmetsp:Transcript_26217/g.56317  ORF Transcript_26217/g.56317 Transcript_26217/m.56317 type:complete len:204 (-) Transcript_26217:645-1256(-)